MANTAPIFVYDVKDILNYIVWLFSVIVQAVAFVHCVPQRSDGFPAIGTLPKGAWLAILGVCLLLTLLSWSNPTAIFSLIGVGAGAVYLLDVRVGLRDMTDGKGFW